MLTFEEKLLNLAKISRAGFDAINGAIPAPTDVDVSDVVTEEKIIHCYKDLETRILVSRSRKFEGKLPLYISMHGGGFMQGCADFDTKYVERSAAKVPCVIINIDYKLAPEYPFPTALEECYHTILWAIDHAEELNIDPTKIAMGGHSSGAGLAVSLAMLNRARNGFPCCGLVLDYPPVDMQYPELKTELPDTMDGGAVDGAFFNTCYLDRDVDRFNLFASPIMVENAAGLPQALFIVGALDGLKKPARVLADKMTAAGVEVEFIEYADCRHGFMTLPKNGTPEGFREGWNKRWEYLSQIFA